MIHKSKISILFSIMMVFCSLTHLALAESAQPTTATTINVPVVNVSQYASQNGIDNTWEDPSQYQIFSFKLDEFNLDHVHVTIESGRFVVVKAEKIETVVLSGESKTYTTKRSRMTQRLHRNCIQNKILISRIRAYWIDGILRIVIPILD